MVDGVLYFTAGTERIVIAADASTGVLMSVHNSLPTQMILRYGSDEQKATKTAAKRPGSARR